MRCRKCGYRSCACGMRIKTAEEIAAMTTTGKPGNVAEAKQAALEAEISELLDLLEDDATADNEIEWKDVEFRRDAILRKHGRLP